MFDAQPALHARSGPQAPELGLSRPSTRYLSNVDVVSAEAERRGISVMPLGARNILFLSGFGKTARLFGTITDRTSHLAVKLADDKRATKQLLSVAQLPTPSWYAVDLEDQAVNALIALGEVVVLKPHNGSQGHGVSVRVNTETQVRQAFRRASRFSRIVMVERYRSGRDYRIMVVDGKVAAVAERKPPAVIGDGERSIGALIEAENSGLCRGDSDERPLTKITVDGRIEECLRQSGMTLSTIPEQGQIIILNPIGSLSSGSSSIDCTDDIHPEIAALAVDATKLIGLDIAGVDIVAGDISLPVNRANAEIIEINSSPGMRAHLYPIAGQVRNPAVNIIDYLFPASSTCLA